MMHYFITHPNMIATHKKHLWTKVLRCFFLRIKRFCFVTSSEIRQPLSLCSQTACVRASWPFPRTDAAPPAAWSPFQRLLGSHAQVLADVEEPRHGRQGFPCFYIVHIPWVLPDGQAHIPRRDFPLAPKLCQAYRKKVFVHTIHHLSCYILSNRIVEYIWFIPSQMVKW